MRAVRALLLAAVLLGTSAAVAAPVAAGPTARDSTILPQAGPAGAASVGCVIDVSSAIGWWPGEGSLAAAIGPGLDGTATFEPALVGRGIRFDGTTTSASTAALPTVDAEVSVEAWVKPEPSGVVQAIFSRWTWPGGGSEDSFILMLGPNGALWWATDDPSTLAPVPVESVQPQLFDGQFHHVAATWSPTGSTLYVDGVVASSATGAGPSVNPAEQTAFALGGSSGPGSGMPFRGVIDEATVYDRALGAAEVAAVHDAGADGKCARWNQQAQIPPAGGAAGDAFGSSVAVDGDTMVVGAFNEDQQRGRVRVMERTGTTWSQQAVLTASDALPGDLFGWSVAVDGDTAVVGAIGTAPGDPGSTYVFTRSGTTWTQQAILAAADGVQFDEFGDSVAVSGSTVVVGAAYHDAPASNTGAAYVFERTGVAWAQQAKLTAPAPEADDLFGYSVGLDGDTVVVGSHLDDDSGDAAGSASVFTRAGGVWARQALLLAPDGTAADFLGWSVAVDGDVAVVGAMNDDAAALYGGSAHAFTRVGTTWLGPARLVGVDTATDDSFGYDVDVSGVTAAIGAPGADRASAGSGSAYVFVAGG